MELWTGALSWWICHWPDLKSAGLFPRNLFLSSLKTSTLNLTLWPINSGVLTSLLHPHLSWSLTDSLPSLNLLCHSKTDVRFMQDGQKAAWSILYVSVAFFPSGKQNFIAYRSSKVSSRPDCIFEIHQLWQSDFSRVYSNCCCSCSFESEIINIAQSFHKMYSNNIPNFQESTTILGPFTQEELDSVLRKIKNRKAAGLDEIPPEVWKTRQFDDILLRHCNAVYNQNPIDRWMKGCILPFPKKGDLGLAKNYRGITLTS